MQLLGCLAGVEMILKDVGYPVKLGSGVAAASAYLQNTIPMIPSRIWVTNHSCLYFLFLLFQKFCKIYITLFYTPLKMNVLSTFSFNALLLLLSCISKIIASYDLICHCVMVIKFISRGYWIAYGYKRNPSNILFAQLILSYCVKFMWVSLNIWVAFSIWWVPFPN